MYLWLAYTNTTEYLGKRSHHFTSNKQSKPQPPPQCIQSWVFNYLQGSCDRFLSSCWEWVLIGNNLQRLKWLLIINVNKHSQWLEATTLHIETYWVIFCNMCIICNTKNVLHRQNFQCTSIGSSLSNFLWTLLLLLLQLKYSWRIKSTRIKLSGVFSCCEV